MHLNVAVARLLLATILGMTSALAAAAESSVRRYELPDNGQLALRVPDGWIDNVNQPPGRLPPTISFKQKSGAPFAVLVTPIWAVDPTKRLTPEKVEQIVRSSAKQAEPQSVERKLEIKPLKGSVGTGHYFVATDKAPAPGEFKYMMQGAIGVAELVLTFTVLTNDGQTDIATQATAMITSARHLDR